MFRLCCPYITTDRRGSLWVGQDKEEGVCGRPLGARQMAEAIFGAETAGGTAAWGELEGTGGGDRTPPFIDLWPVNTIGICF
jgi:hypothetical protein